MHVHHFRGERTSSYKEMAIKFRYLGFFLQDSHKRNEYLVGTPNTGNTKFYLTYPSPKLISAGLDSRLIQGRYLYQIARNGTRFVRDISIVLIVLASAKLNI